MRIGGTKINKLNPRFWWILGGAGVFVVFVLYMLSASAPVTTDPLRDPEFSPSKLASLPPDWIDRYVSDYGVRKPPNQGVLTQQYSTHRGLPISFKAYVPTDESGIKEVRPSLYVQKYGWQFEPASFIDPSVAGIDSSYLAGLEEEAISGQPLDLGFRGTDIPAPGQAYEFTGLLYWRSDRLKSPSAEEAELSPSPVVLVSGYRPLSSAELEAPTTHVAPLDITYTEGNYVLTLHRLEWSAGNEVRVCVSLHNKSDRGPVPVWPGVLSGGMLIDIGQGTKPGEPEDQSAFSTQELLAFEQTISGYVTFPEAIPSGGPQAGVDVKLYMPPLTSGSFGSATGLGGAGNTVTVTPDQFYNVTDSDVSSLGGGCSGPAADLGSGDISAQPLLVLPQDTGSGI